MLVLIGIIVVTGLIVYLVTQRDRSYPTAETLRVIKSAMQNKRRLRMTYFTYSSKRFSDRIVTPLDLQGDVYLVAQDSLRNAERTFKVSRIRSIVELP